MDDETLIARWRARGVFLFRDRQGRWSWIVANRFRQSAQSSGFASLDQAAQDAESVFGPLDSPK